MLAIIEKVEDNNYARFERLFNHSVEVVWAAITENGKLEKWMSNLEMKDLKKEGTIKFNMNDGTDSFIEMKIRDFQKYSLLEFEWGEDWVRFELYSKPIGCLIVLKEKISAINDHTSKDLAGWHVCLNMLSALLDGNVSVFPKEEWEVLLEKYISLVNHTK